MWDSPQKQTQPMPLKWTLQWAKRKLRDVPARRVQSSCKDSSSNSTTTTSSSAII